MTVTADRKKIIIVGAGFAGLSAAKEFERLAPRLRGVEVTLLDRNNYNFFTPLLFQISTGAINAYDICSPVRSLLKKTYVKFCQREVNAVDTARKKVVMADGELGYDYLVLAPGSTTNFYGIPGLAEHVLPMKNAREGMALHNQIVGRFEAAMCEPDAAKRAELLTFLIVGGGASGVETAAATAVFVFRRLATHFPSLIPEVKVLLAEAGDTLLRGMHPPLAKESMSRLEKLGVEVILNCAVATCAASGITTRDGRKVASRNVVWVGGVRPDKPVTDLTAEKAKDGRVVVSKELEIPSLPGVFVVGDCAFVIPGEGARPCPQTAQAALQMGPAAARSIAARIRGEPSVPFQYKFKGEMVFLECGSAAGFVFGKTITGWQGYVLWAVYHWLQVPGFRRKLMTFVDWMSDNFGRRYSARL